MASITTTVTAITKMLRGRMEAFPIDVISGQPTLHSVRYFVNQLVTFAIHFVTTKWGGKHGLLPLVLGEAKMRLAARNRDLDYDCLKKLQLLNPRI